MTKKGTKLVYVKNEKVKNTLKSSFLQLLEFSELSKSDTTLPYTTLHCELENTFIFSLK